METTRILARYILGYDARPDDHRLLRDGELVIAGDSVVFVGHGYAGSVAREVDFGNSLVFPGCIDLNAAADLEDSDLFLDAGGDASLSLGRTWSEAYYRAGPRDLSDPEEERRKYEYALCRLLLSGTTTALPVTGLLHRAWAERREEFEEVAAIASRIGLRVFLGPSFRDGVNVVDGAGRKTTRWNAAAGMEGLAGAAAFIRDLGSDPLVGGALIPSTVETCSEALLLATARAARELGVPVRLHATQSRWEYDAIRERYGRTPVEHIEAVGLLDRRFLLPHALHLGVGSDGVDDTDRLRRAGATILHCPDVIARHGDAPDSLARFLGTGLRVAVATDCCPPDMIHAMRIALLTGRVAARDGAAVTAAAIFRAATLAGAEALGRPDLGRLRPGARADFAVAGLDGYHVNAVDDPVRALILSCGGRDITDVFVNGRHVVRNRTIPGVDLPGLRAWADGYLRRMKHSYPERDYLRRSVDELCPPVFPRWGEA